MAYDIDTQHEQNREPNAQVDIPLVVKYPHGVVDKNAGLEDKDGVTHQEKDLPHGVPLVAVVQGTIVFIGNHPPQVPDKIPLHIDDEDQEEEAQQQEENLDSL